MNGPRAPGRGKRGMEQGGDDGLRQDGAILGEREEPWPYASSGFIKAEYRGSLRDSFGAWIEGLGDWQWFITRTLAGPTSPGFTAPGRGTARECLRDLLVRTAARRCVCVFEMQKRGVLHLHALLETRKGINGGVEQERDFSKYGIARWKAYKRGAGASAYLGKYLTKDVVEMYILLDGPMGEVELRGHKLDWIRV